MANNTNTFSETEINQNGLKVLNQIISGKENIYESIINYQLFEDAVQGDADAQFFLGLQYASGDCVEKNEVEAAKWYRKAAEQGHPKAQLMLGYCFRDGEGVKKNYQVSARWIRKAAKQNDPDAQKELGICYEFGNGVYTDRKKAIEWYRKAAKQGNKFAKDALERLEDD